MLYINVVATRTAGLVAFLSKQLVNSPAILGVNQCMIRLTALQDNPALMDTRIRVYDVSLWQTEGRHSLCYGSVWSAALWAQCPEGCPHASTHACKFIFSLSQTHIKSHSRPHAGATLVSEHII